MRVPRLEPGGFENRPGIAHEHVIDLILGDAGGAEGGQDVVRDVVVVPARACVELFLLGEEIRPAIGVVGEDHLARVALGAEPGQRLDALRGGQEVLEAEAIHADGAPALHEPAEVAEVVTVAAVADDHAAQAYAFLGEDGLLRLARASRRPRVRGDGHARGLLGPRARAQDVLDHRRDALGVRGALDDGGLDARAADALGDVAYEEIGDLVDPVAEEIALGHPPHAGGHDHLHARAASHVDDQLDVAAEIHRGEVDDGTDTAVVEVRPVLVYPWRTGDDVLVHEGAAEGSGGDGPKRGGDRRRGDGVSSSDAWTTATCRRG